METTFSSHVSLCFVTSLMLTTLVLTFLPPPTSASYLSDVSVCSRQNSELSCIVGCSKCAMIYGRKNYDMGACCLECQLTAAAFVDDGPEHCSPRFFAPEVSEYFKGKRQRQARSVLFNGNQS